MSIRPLQIRPRELDDGQVQTSREGSIVFRMSDEPTEKQRLRLIELSGTLDFWDRAEEDIYGPNDGEPL